MRFAFCFHVAFARALPVPFGAMVTYGCLPLFYLYFKFKRPLSDKNRVQLHLGQEEASAG